MISPGRNDLEGRALDCIIIGGGPAGLTAAFELIKSDRRALVLEADSDVGGISKTCEHKGYRFDLGGHRFFTKVPYVQQLWIEILGDEFLSRPRLSRIHYKGKMFDYPLKPMNALFGLGIFESARIGTSYVKAMVLPKPKETNFEEWVTNRFGKRLYEIFFKTYTEKVWGMPCTEISAEWAGQRIKNLDLGAAVMNAFLGGRTGKGKGQITSLIEHFQYPRYGPGQLWNCCADKIRESGSEVRLNSEVTSIRHNGDRVLSVAIPGQEDKPLAADHFLTSMPIRELIAVLDPPPPAEVLQAAAALRYRDFMTVVLIVDRPELFPDNWIYIHSPDVHVGRVQNFKNWSPDMVPDKNKTTLGLEYFVQEGDELWSMADEDLIEMAGRECALLNLAPADALEGGTVIRVKKAYPVYGDDFQRSLNVIRTWLQRLQNLQLIGRNGQHRYNNQDHSMMTGVLAARNILGEENDVWAVNVDQDYHEEGQGLQEEEPVDQFTANQNDGNCSSVHP